MAIEQDIWETKTADGSLKLQVSDYDPQWLVAHPIQEDRKEGEKEYTFKLCGPGVQETVGKTKGTDEQLEWLLLHAPVLSYTAVLSVLTG